MTIPMHEKESLILKQSSRLNMCQDKENKANSLHHSMICFHRTKFGWVSKDMTDFNCTELMNLLARASNVNVLHLLQRLDIGETSHIPRFGCSISHELLYLAAGKVPNESVFVPGRSARQENKEKTTEPIRQNEHEFR